MLSEELNHSISKLKTDLVVKKSRRDLLQYKMAELEKNINELNIDVLNQAAYVLQKLSEQQRNLAKARLEDLGTQALQYSLGSNYKMIIDIDDSRKRPQASLQILNLDTDISTEPLDDNGGGVVDIISIALRLVTLQSLEPCIDGPIILDEPFKMVSEEYVPMLSEFLKKISIDFGRQVIIVTHNNYLAENCTTTLNISDMI